MNRPPASQRFDARRATSYLLLLGGSLVAGLTTFWLTPKAAAAQAQTTSETAQAGTTPGNAWAWEEDDQPQQAGAWASPADQPGFSMQPQQAPRGWSRGS